MLPIEERASPETTLGTIRGLRAAARDRSQQSALDRDSPGAVYRRTPSGSIQPAADVADDDSTADSPAAIRQHVVRATVSEEFTIREAHTEPLLQALRDAESRFEVGLAANALYHVSRVRPSLLHTQAAVQVLVDTATTTERATLSRESAAKALDQLRSHGIEPFCRREILDALVDGLATATPEMQWPLAKIIHGVFGESEQLRRARYYERVLEFTARRITQNAWTDSCGALYYLSVANEDYLASRSTVDTITELFRPGLGNRNLLLTVQHGIEVAPEVWAQEHVVEALLGVADPEHYEDEAQRIASCVRQLVGVDPAIGVGSVTETEALLAQGNADVRVEAAWALSNVAEAHPTFVARSAPTLAGALGDRNDVVQLNSTHALAQIATSDPRAVLQTDALERITPFFVGEAGQRRVNAQLLLRNLFADNDVDSRRYLTYVDEMLSECERPANDLLRVVAALDFTDGRRYLDEVESLLERVLAHADTTAFMQRFEAVITLAEMTDAPAAAYEQHLEALCEHGQWALRCSVARDDLHPDHREILAVQLAENVGGVGFPGDYVELYDQPAAFAEDVLSQAGAVCLARVAEERPAVIESVPEELIDLLDHDVDFADDDVVTTVSTVASASPSLVAPHRERIRELAQQTTDSARRGTLFTVVGKLTGV